MIEEAPEPRICKNCNNQFHGLYCNQCGEKVILPKDRKLSNVVGSILAITSIVDNKFFKSLKLVVANPGFLSREYADGRRVRYMRPLQLFFILNLIYFIFPVLQMFNSSFKTQLYVLPHGRIAQTVSKAWAAKENMPLTSMELIYNTHTTNLAKMIVVIFVLFAALPLSLIFMKKNRFLTDHAVLSIELTCFNLAVNTIALTIVLWIGTRLLKWGELTWGTFIDDIALTGIFVATNFYFLWRAANTFYNQKGKRRIIKAILGILGLFVALEAYRFVLFFVTLWTM